MSKGLYCGLIGDEQHMTDQRPTDESPEKRRKEPRPAGGITAGEIVFLLLLLGTLIVLAAGRILLR